MIQYIHIADTLRLSHQPIDSKPKRRAYGRMLYPLGSFGDFPVPTKCTRSLSISSGIPVPNCCQCLEKPLQHWIGPRQHGASIYQMK